MEPERDLAIEFTGLNEGEKISEELWEEWERPAATENERIMVVGEQNPQAAGILRKIERMERYLAREDCEGLLDYLAELAPGFSEGATGGRRFRRAESGEWRVGRRGGGMRIPLSQPDIGEREIEYVTNVLRSGQLSLGPQVAEFEEKFAELCGDALCGGDE